MHLFGRKKENREGCCCKDISAAAMEQAKEVQPEQGAVLVLGGGCAKCHELEENTKAALTELGLTVPVELITDFTQIAAYGVMTTPALVVGGKVVSYGKVLKKEQIIELLKEKL